MVQSFLRILSKFIVEWTLDLQNRYISEVYRDLNGNNQVDEYDQLGFLYPHDLMVECYAYAAGVKVAPFDEDGVPRLAISDDAAPLVDFWEKMYRIKSNDRCFEVQAVSGVSTNTTSMKFFSGGNILFVSGFLFNTTSDLRDMTDDYGILPLPKRDEEQTNYITVSKDGIRRIWKLRP